MRDLSIALHGQEAESYLKFTDSIGYNKFLIEQKFGYIYMLIDSRLIRANQTRDDFDIFSTRELAEKSLNNIDKPFRKQFKIIQLLVNDRFWYDPLFKKELKEINDNI